MAKTLEEVLEFAKEIMTDGKGEKKVIKTIPMKASWIELREEARKTAALSEAAFNKAKSVSEEMWAKIKRDLDYPEANLSITDDGKTLELIEKN